MSLFSDDLEKLFQAHLALKKMDVHYTDKDIEFIDGVMTFKEPSKMKMMFALQGDDGTAANAIDAIEEYAKDHG